MDYRLEINGTEVDLPAGAQAPVIVRQLFAPETATPSVGDLTYNLVLPRTAKNEALLQWAYYPDRLGGADLLPKLLARVVAGSTLILDGQVQIEGITPEGIRARIYGLNTTWQDRLEGRVLQDIDFGTFGYSGVDPGDYGLESLFDVWQTTEADGLPLQFPLVSYGNFAADPGNTAPNPLNDGAQTVAGSAGLIDGALIDNRQAWPFTIEEFRPAPYLRYVMRRLLAEAGLAAGGGFFKDSYFDNILLPYTNDNDEGFALPEDLEPRGAWEADHPINSVVYNASITDNPDLILSEVNFRVVVTDTFALNTENWINILPTRTTEYEISINEVVTLGVFAFFSGTEISVWQNATPTSGPPPTGNGTQIFTQTFTGSGATNSSRTVKVRVNLGSGVNYRVIVKHFFSGIFFIIDQRDVSVSFNATINQVIIRGQLDIRLALPRIDALDWLRGTLNHFGLVLIVGRDGRTATVEARQTLYGTSGPAYTFDRADYREGNVSIPRQPATIVLDYDIEDDEALYPARQFAATHSNGRGYHEGERVDTSFYAATGSRNYLWLTQGITTPVPTLNTRDEFAKLLGRLGDGSEVPKYSYKPRILRWVGLQVEPDATGGLWVEDVEYLQAGQFAWPKSVFVDTFSDDPYADSSSLAFGNGFGAPGLYERLHRLQLRVIASAQQLEVEGLVYPHEIDLWEPGTALGFAGHRWLLISIDYRPAADQVTRLRLIKVL